MSLIIHVSEMADFPDAMYIGRANGRAKLKASPFANPFKIGRDGDRATVLRRYEDEYLFARPDLLRQMPTLRDHPLACWCRRSDEARTPENHCHGDILAHLLSVFTDAFFAACAAELEQDGAA